MNCQLFMVKMKYILPSYILLLLSFTTCAQRDSIRPIMADTPSSFPGGVAAMNNYIREKLIYPQQALERGIGGNCNLSFYVEPDGSITEVKIIRGVPDCPQCDQEAIRLTQAMPQWIPATQNGTPVRTKQTITLKFKVF